ncbi:MAG: hypothetical protein U5K79_23490 [Cyclobacteriaceae bacterium]|nr:hypothetical protein [Cyclobacteriaceae bacterium]
MKTFSQLLAVLMLVAGLQSATGQTISQVLNKRVDALKAQSDKERVFIISDRDLYSPGEDVWLTAMVYDIFSPALSNLSASVYVTVYNSDQAEVFGKNFPMVNGIASGSLTLPDDIPDDVYYLKGETSLSGGPGWYFKKIIVNQKSVAPFVVEATMADQLFKPGEEISMTVSFKDYYNEPIPNISYQIDFFDGDKKLTELSGKIKKELSAIVKFNVPQTLASGLLNYRITANQKTREAVLTGQLKTISDKIFVEFFPESGKLVDNIQTNVRFYAYDAAGQPVRASGSLMARDVKLLPVASNSHGLGTFSLTPNATAEYTLQLDLPEVGIMDFPLPVVQPQGMTLQFGSSSEKSVSGLIKSNFPSETSSILIAESNGAIIHLSEQKVGAEYPMTIDISKAQGNIIHLILSSADADILAEQLIFTGGMNIVEQLAPVNSQEFVRGKMVYELASPTGTTVMSAVNQPWVLSNLFNQQPWLMGYPYDLMQQPMYQSESFLSGIMDEQLLKEYLMCYTPSLFSWDKVLNSQGGQAVYKPSKLVAANRALLDKIKIHGIESRANDMVQHTNMNASSYFIISNPKFLTALYEQKTEKIPSYLKMLQSGTPLMEVIQTIKPYKLEGSNIVFFGTRPLLSQQLVNCSRRSADRHRWSEPWHGCFYPEKNISSFDVAKIAVSTNPIDVQRYTGLNSVGVVEIWLKKGQA